MADNEVGSQLPASNRPDDDVRGHWLLARLGKRVLRPATTKHVIVAEASRVLRPDGRYAIHRNRGG
jgi:hypothetical protein